MARRYRSAIRVAQVEQTRQRLLAATHDLLADGPPDALTLPRLAQAAKVSVPTVYRHFPTVEALLRAFLDWIRPKLGQNFDDLLGRTPRELARLPLENFPRFEEHRAVLLPLMDSQAWNRVRVGSQTKRAERGAAALRSLAPGWSDRDLEGAAGAFWALATPAVWRWLKETWGLDAETAARSASWAMHVLLTALEQPAPLARLDEQQPKRKPKRAT